MVIRQVRQFLAELERFVNLLDTLKMTADYMEFDRIRKLENLNQPPEPLPPRLALVHRVMVVPPVHDEDEQDDHPLSGDAAFRPLDREEVRVGLAVTTVCCMKAYLSLSVD